MQRRFNGKKLIAIFMAAIMALSYAPAVGPAAAPTSAPAAPAAPAATSPASPASPAATGTQADGVANANEGASANMGASAIPSAITNASVALANATINSIRFYEDSSGKLSAIFTVDAIESTNDGNALGIVAIYRDSGALYKVTENTIAIKMGEIITEEIEADVPPGYTAKAFLWDAVTYAPLCEAATSISPADKTEVSYTAVQTGGTPGASDSTGVSIVFSELVTGLTADDIIVSNVTGAATVESFSGSGTNWALALSSVELEGNLMITIQNFGVYRVTPQQQTVAVYRNTALRGAGWEVLRENANISINPDTAGDGGSVTVNMQSWPNDYADLYNFVTRTINSANDLGGATDFTITAKVSGGLSQNYQGVGIAVHVPGNTGSIVVALRRFHTMFGGSTGNRNLGIMHQGGGAADGASGGESYTGDTRGEVPVWLKIQKTGTTYSAYYSYVSLAYDAASGTDPENQWVPCASGSDYTRSHSTITNRLSGGQDVSIGFFASSGGSNNPILATVSDFRLNGKLIPVSRMLPIKSISTLPTLTASVEAAFNELSLPTTVQATLENGSSYVCDIDWSSAEASYDPNSSVSQTLYGELLVAPGMNPLNLKASTTFTLSDDIFGISVIPKSDPWLWLTAPENTVELAIKAQRADGLRDLDPKLCTFTSLDPTVATVDSDGIVTAVSEGFATIRCEYLSSTSGLMQATTDIVAGTPQGKIWRVASPTGESEIRFKLSDTGVLSYATLKNGKYSLDFANIGLTTNVGDFSTGLTFKEVSAALEINNTYPMYSGKYSEFTNHYKEQTITFTKGAAEYSIVARAYDDGTAFRHRVAANAPNIGDLTISNEPTYMKIPSGATIWTTLRTGSSFEYQSRYDEYTTQTLGTAQGSAGRPVFPILYRVPKADMDDEYLYGLITEAGLTPEYIGSTTQHTGDGLLRLIFDLNQTSAVRTSATMTKPWESPWRTVINGSLGEIVETMMVENLSPAADEGTYKFSEWVEPGVSSWSWVSFYGGQAIKQNHLNFIDLASEMGWQYYILDEGWQPRVYGSRSGETTSSRLGELYVYSGENAPGVAPAGPSTYRSLRAESGPYAGQFAYYDGKLDWYDDVAAYAQEKGVKLIAWVNSRDISSPEWLEKRLSEFKAMGIVGIKSDFFLYESQDRMEVYEELYKATAKYGMLLNCHGTNKPTGELRTYPNALAREAIDGQESGGLNAFQYTISPFSRGVVGTADITEQVSRDSARATNGFQIALSVMFESGMHSLGSGPAAYLDDPIIYSFYKNFPARWSDIKFIDGDVAQHVSLARKEYGSDNWYACTISNVGGEKQLGGAPSFGPAFTFTSKITTDYLDEGEEYYALVYREKERENPAQGYRNALQFEIHEKVKKGDVISVPIQPSGGCVVVFRKDLPLIEGLDVANKNVSVRVDEYYQIPVLYTNPDTAALRELVCESDDENIATVSSAGMIVGVNEGTAKITVRPRFQLPGSDIKVEITVTVLPPEFTLTNGWEVTRRNKDFTILSETSVKIRSTNAAAEIPESSTQPVPNILLKEFPNNVDWEAVIKISGGLNADWQTAGLIAYAGPTTLGIASRRRHSSFGTHCFCFRTPSNEWRVNGNDTQPNADAYLRLVKTGNLLRASWSYDGATFTAMDGNTNSSYNIGTAATIKLGVIIANGSGSTADVDVVFSDFYFKTASEAALTLYPFAESSK